MKLLLNNLKPQNPPHNTVYLSNSIPRFVNIKPLLSIYYTDNAVTLPEMSCSILSPDLVCPYLEFHSPLDACLSTSHLSKPRIEFSKLIDSVVGFALNLLPQFHSWLVSLTFTLFAEPVILWPCILTPHLKPCLILVVFPPLTFGIS